MVYTPYNTTSSLACDDECLRWFGTSHFWSPIPQPYWGWLWLAFYVFGLLFMFYGFYLMVKFPVVNPKRPAPVKGKRK